MSHHHLLHATNILRSSVSSLKKKVSNLKISLEILDAEIEQIDSRFDKLLTASEVYQAAVERDSKREIKRLEKEIEALRANVQISTINQSSVSSEDLRTASTIAIFETILRLISENAEDFRLISYSFLFPAVIERVMRATDEAYFLDELPMASEIVIRRGQEYISWIRGECETHLTDPEAWEAYAPLVCDWWRNDALPLLYGTRDENWDIDIPYSDVEMMSWRDNPADRPIHFSTIFDAYEIYRNNKDEVYEKTGLREFEMKMFAFTQKP